MEAQANGEHRPPEHRSAAHCALIQVGSQFPPYDPDSPDSWGVQHVMHPDMGEPAFARWYTSDPLIEAAKGLLDCNEDKLQMGE